MIFDSGAFLNLWNDL